MPDVSEINIGSNGTENNHTLSRACEPLTIVLIENALSKSKVVIHDWNIQLNYIV